MSRLGTIPHSMNIAGSLSELAHRNPSTSALLNRGSMSYSELDQASDEIALGLRAIGIEPGARAVLMVPPGRDLFPLVFAVLKAAVVPVLIDPGIGRRNLAQCIREAEPEVFIGVRRAVAAGRLLGWGRATLQRWIVAGGTRPLLNGRPRPTTPPRSSSPAAAPARPRVPSTLTASWPRRSH